MNLNRPTIDPGPLTEDDIDAQLAQHFPPARYSATRWPPCDISPRCTGPCDQGDRPCPTPNDCYVPEGDGIVVDPPFTRCGLALILIVAALCLAAAFGLLRGLP